MMWQMLFGPGFVHDFFITWAAATLVFLVIAWAFGVARYQTLPTIVGALIIGLIYTICDAIGMMPL